MWFLKAESSNYIFYFYVIKSHIWHSRPAHPSNEILDTLVKTSSIEYAKSFITHVFSSYAMSKSQKLPFKTTHVHCQKPFKLLYIDLSTSIIWRTIGVKYFMLIVNIYSRYIWIFFLKAKDELARTFISFRHIIERNFDTNIRSVQSNGGKVFQFLSYTLHSIGINHQKICPYTFEHNSVMEIRTKRVVERGFIVLIHSRLDIKC